MSDFSENEVKIAMHGDAPFSCILDGCQFVKMESVAERGQEMGGSGGGGE